jgi:hypothetical protein
MVALLQDRAAPSAAPTQGRSQRRVLDIRDEGFPSELPSFIDVENLLTTIFDDHRSTGVVLRHRRFLWIAHTG